MFDSIHKLSSVKPQEPKAEKVIKMRDATPEEIKSIDKYIRSISKPTVVNFWDLEQEPSGDLISRRAVLELVADYDLSMGQVVRGIHALPSVNSQDCDTCEVGNPCLYCKHEFEPPERSE